MNIEFIPDAVFRRILAKTRIRPVQAPRTSAPRTAKTAALAAWKSSFTR